MAILSGVGGLSVGLSARVCRSGTQNCLRERGWANESGTRIGERLAGVAVARPGDGALVSGPVANSISTPARSVEAAVATTNHGLIFHRIDLGKGIALVPLVKSTNFLNQIRVHLLPICES